MNSNRGDKIDIVNDIFRVIDPSSNFLFRDINIVAVDRQFMEDGNNCILWDDVGVDGIYV